MKSKIKNICISLIAGLLLINGALFAQSNINDEQILSAMRDELNRNMDSIKYDGYERPFFIGYALFPGEAIRVEASNGAIKSSVRYPVNNSWTRVMVGDYQFNDENYSDRTKRKRHHDGAMSMPLDDNYWAIRRSFWMSTNNVYKNATETYASKLEAMALKGIDKDSLEVDDFSKAPVVKYNQFKSYEPIDVAPYEKVAKEVSKVFKNTPSIYSNDVDIFEHRANCFFVNSEGTEVVQPFSASGLMIKAFAYTPDYQTEGAFLSYVGKSIADMPSTTQIKNDVQEMIKHIEQKKNLPVFEDSYVGPILFMGQAVPKFLIYKLLNSGKGLVARRNILINNANRGLNLTNYRTWENRLNKRVVDRSINVYSVTSGDNYNGTKLIGSYDVDAEGVEPADTLVLIEGGELRNQLVTRTPVEKFTKSTGSKRYGYSGGVSTSVVPGNLFFESSKTFKTIDLKKKLIDIAIDNGLDYAIIVKSVGRAGVNSAIEVYKVNVEDGKEQLLRSVSLSKIDQETLWEIEGVSDRNEVLNVLLNGNSRNMASSRTSEILSGAPTSFIYPEAVLIERGSVEGRKKPMKGIKPLVPSPL